MNQTTGWFRKNKYWTRLSGARGLAFLSACTGLWVVHAAPIPIQVTDAAWRCGHGYEHESGNPVTFTVNGQQKVATSSSRVSALGPLNKLDRPAWAIGATVALVALTTTFLAVEARGDRAKQ